MKHFHQVSNELLLTALTEDVDDADDISKKLLAFLGYQII